MKNSFLLYFFIFLSLFISYYCIDSISGSNNDYLNIFVVPHSHNDPGWWFTFEKYYTQWTKGIISSVIKALDEDPKRTFIWCETSFFSRWWKDQDNITKDTVKRLVRNGQLEFVGGGWVMNDEASVDIHQIINQYTAGHQWLLENIGEDAIPTIGWAIDPFGHSSAMAWAHREMGFDGMVINRVHQDIKTDWNANQKLEFAWDRPWNMGNRSCLNNNENTDKRWEGDGMLTHMLAYKLYDIPNTCGPDWDICAEFDFERPISIEITNDNVEERSLILLNQYRKKHKAFSHNNLLVPLGDDFKYKNIDITRKIMDNYQLMFDYINSHSELKVNIRFATLREYFNAVKLSVDPVYDLPRYNDDFFTYSDRDNDYWSGYYTTRPYLKKLIRTTESDLRSAQILLSFGNNLLSDYDKQINYNYIRECSEILGLLQHHDAITGTAKQVVANDYTTLITSSKSAVQSITTSLIPKILCILENSEIVPLQYIQEEQVSKHDSLYKLISIQNGDISIIIFNSLANEYNDIVKIMVDTYSISIYNSNNELINGQISPVIEYGNILEDRYWLYFKVSLSGLMFSSYTIKFDTNPNNIDISSVYDISNGNIIPFCNINSNNYKYSTSIENTFYTVNLNKETSQIDSVIINESGKALTLDQEYRLYSTRGGSYLFSPSGESNPIKFNANEMKGYIIKGNLVEESIGYSSEYSIGTDIILLKSTDKSIGMKIGVNHFVNMDSSNYNNKELVSRLTLNIDQNTFWTDSSGLDMIKRQYSSQLPIQANFYPITNTLVKRDSNIQLSILVKHALGVGTRSTNTLELMLDRRTMQDDGRGMGERVTDQAKVNINMWYIIEDISSFTNNDNENIYFNSISSLLPKLNYPLNILFTSSSNFGSSCKNNLSFISSNLPDSLELFSMNPTSQKGNEIVLRFSHLNPYSIFDTKNINIENLFYPFLQLESMKEKTASLLHTLEIKNDFIVTIPTMSIRTYIININELNLKDILINYEYQKNMDVIDKEIEEQVILPLPNNINFPSKQVQTLKSLTHNFNRISTRFIEIPLMDYYIFLLLSCMCIFTYIYLFLLKKKKNILH